MCVSRLSVIAWLLTAIAAGAAIAAIAAPPPIKQPPPWGDPQAMFEQIFGKEGEVDKQVLAKIDVSVKEERRIGQRAVEAYLAAWKRQRVRVITRGKEVDYLRHLVKTLQPLMKNRKRYPTIRIYLVLSPQCDARSFPGGHLVFFRGLLETAQSEAALAGIVGHELAHVDRGHQTRRIKQMKLAEQTFGGQNKPMSMEQFFAVGGVMMRAWGRPFRPDLEREADRDGARWSYLAGYDCREMAKLFLKLHQQGNDPNVPVPEFFRSHPAAIDRHRAIMEQYDKLQAEMPKRDLHVGVENHRRHTARGQ